MKKYPSGGLGYFIEKSDFSCRESNVFGYIDATSCGETTWRHIDFAIFWLNHLWD
jgi:hypothetical protein